MEKDYLPLLNWIKVKYSTLKYLLVPMVQEILNKAEKRNIYKFYVINKT